MSESDPDILERLNELIKVKDERIFTRLDDLEVEKQVGKTSAVARCYGVALSGNGMARIDKLSDYLVANILEYCIPVTRIETAKKEDEKYGNHNQLMALGQEARRLFTHLKKSGEAGELLLFTIVTKVLKLPLVLCKMDLKTSTEMHFHGVDGVHACFEKGENGEKDVLGLYWGESKVHKNFGTAVAECIKSLHKFVIEGAVGTPAVQRDIQLIAANLNILDNDLKEAVALFFNPDAAESNQVNYRGVALIGFDEDSYPKGQNSKNGEDVRKEISAKMEEWVKKIEAQIGKYANLNTVELHLFLLPLPDVDVFREEFRKALSV